MDFIHSSVLAVSELKPLSPLCFRHVNILQSLASCLRSLPADPEAGPWPDYLFFASFTYVHQLLLNESDIITTETGRDLILAIYQYRERVNPRKDIQDRFFNSNGCGRAIDANWPSFVNCTEALVIPTPAQEPSADLASIKCAEIQEIRDHTSGDAVVENLHDYHSSIPFFSKTDEE